MIKQISMALPTANIDGSPIAVIDRVELGFGTKTGVYTLFAEDTSFAAQTVAGITTVPYASLNENLAPGVWFTAARVYENGVPSAFSNEASFTVDKPVPQAPTGFTVA